jgi:hypothetical protein
LIRATTAAVIDGVPAKSPDVNGRADGKPNSRSIRIVCGICRSHS